MDFEKLVQYFALKKAGGAPKGYPFAPLRNTRYHKRKLH